MVELNTRSENIESNSSSRADAPLQFSASTTEGREFFEQNRAASSAATDNLVSQGTLPNFDLFDSSQQTRTASNPDLQSSSATGTDAGTDRSDNSFPRSGNENEAGQSDNSQAPSGNDGGTQSSTDGNSSTDGGMPKSNGENQTEGDRELPAEREANTGDAAVQLASNAPKEADDADPDDDGAPAPLDGELILKPQPRRQHPTLDS